MINELESTANEVLVQILQGAVDATNAAVEFSKAQIPEVVEQLLMWHMIESLVFFLMGFASSWAFPFLVKLTIKSAKYESASSCDCFGTVVTSVFLWPAYLAWCLLLMACNLEWLQILVAPKLYLLEYTASLIK